MKLHFKISEFLIVPTLPIEGDIADKILHHIEMIEPVRRIIGKPVYVSKHSGYRPYYYEIQQGRSGESEHTFKGLGAVDYTCENIELLIDLVRKTKYKRVAYYPLSKFVHCDFGEDAGFFIDKGKGWIRQ